MKLFNNLFKSKKVRKTSDFSDFFTKTSGDKKKVIDQILREANKEQREVVREYRRRLKTAG